MKVTVIKINKQTVPDPVSANETGTLQIVRPETLENSAENRVKILIVDDDETILRMLTGILKREGFAPVASKTGFEAMKVLSSSQVDIVLSDIEMPGMSGLELLEYLKERYPSVPVMLMTGNRGLYCEFEILEAGANGFLTKPFRRAELVTRVKALCR